MKKYNVTLTAEERQHLHDLIAAGKAAAQSWPTPASCSRPTPPRAAPPGPTAGSPRPWRSASPPSSGSASGSSSRAWRPPWSARSRTGPAGS